MAAVAMVTKVQNMLNSLQTSQIFAVMSGRHPTTSTRQKLPHTTVNIATMFHEV
jgi:hypothetical protein